MSTVAIVVKKDSYKAGETIDGHVLCDFVRAKFINEIILTIEGEGFVRFSEYGFQKKNWQNHKVFDRIHFTTEETFLHEEIKLYGEGDENVSKFIPSGLYFYPFSFTLPKKLPTTFIGIDFRIWYELRVAIIKPNNEKYQTSFPFDVMDPIDLNTYQINLLGPVSAISEFPTSKIIGQKGVFKLEVEIPKTGIAVKEVIPVTCYVSNPMKLFIKKIRANLLQIIEYNSVKPEKRTRKVVRTIAISQERNVGKEEQYCSRLKIKVREHFRIPNLNHRTYISIDYKIEVIAKTSFGHKNARCLIPVQYGHVPIKEFSTTLPALDSPILYNAKKGMFFI